MTAPNAPAQPGLDLGKPMRWTDGNRATLNVVYHDMRGALVERASGYRDWHDLDILERRAENISPEPPKPVGPDEVTVSVWPDGAMSLMHGHPPAVQVRYLRADLAVRKVKPLTYSECQAIAYATNDGLDGVKASFRDIMAARGIEVGE